eukprot:418009-Rhodomonas_salina.4
MLRRWWYSWRRSRAAGASRRGKGSPTVTDCHRPRVLRGVRRLPAMGSAVSAVAARVPHSTGQALH